jgi:hypothetical protein
MKQYKSVQELFRDLPETILLVGNGKMNDKGALIDSYEFVIRFNDFEIEGYESDVGTKVDAISFHCSDFTYHHTKVLEKNYLKYKNISHIFTTSPFFTYSKKDILHLEPNTKMLDVFLPIISNPELRLSSGATLSINLSLLFLKNVHLIGFDFMQSGHYWDSNFSNKQFWIDMGKVMESHNGNYEKQILSKIKNINFIS